MVKLSIVIPYYNTLELTKKLLDKLLEQKTKEVEIILVDDGCLELELDQYHSINIIHLSENKGGAGATNVGLNLAKGDYVALIDSDDMVADDYIETLLKTMENQKEDLIFFDWQDMGSGAIIHHPKNYAPWKCIYKREKMPRFIEGWIYSYDVPFQETINELNLSKYYIDKVLYFYNSTRPDNLTHKKEEIIKKEQNK